MKRSPLCKNFSRISERRSMPDGMHATSPSSVPLSADIAATLACLYEATARKPGNVHPGASFDEATTYTAFVASAVAIGPVMASAPAAGVGETVLRAVQATRRAVQTNTNLGTILLLAPLSAVPPSHGLASGIGTVLRQLTGSDTRAVYEAIRVSGAGGLGDSAEADVFAEVPPELTLVQAMRLAAERDLVARQYTNGFSDVLSGPAVWIEEVLSLGASLEEAIIHAYLQQMARSPDSLIQRKCGLVMAQEAGERAAAVLKSGTPGDATYEQAIREFDRWLRADGNRRNPGTTADLIAAGLFVLMRDSRLHWKEW
jgi:triphosphoribosyl-dephospho-CoA synthase